MVRRIGIIPWPLYLVLLAEVVYLACVGPLATDVTTMIAVIALGAFACAGLGEAIPGLKKIGGPALLCTILPSLAIYYRWLPARVVNPVIDFSKYTVFLYLYIAFVVVGSILGMDRIALIRCFLKIFVPITAGTVIAGLAGLAVARLVGLGWHEALFFVIIPTMAGGTGEGAIPLSIGYAQLLPVTQGEAFARVLPPVVLASFTAMLLAGALNVLGERRPELTGRGQLQPGQDEIPDLQGKEKAAADPAGIAAAVLFIASLYLAGVVGNDLCGLPAPVGMVFLAVATKLLHWAPAKLQKGCGLVYKFSSVALTYPTLFAVSLAITPWDKLVGACAPRYLLTVATVVIAMTATGYALARRLKMYPIDLAIVTSCRCSKGGVGDVAILDTANRMELMPFAQTATRIGGAVTVTLALIALRHWH